MVSLIWKFLLPLTGGHYVLGIFSKGHNFFIFKDKILKPSNLKRKFQAFKNVFIHGFQ